MKCNKTNFLLSTSSSSWQVMSYVSTHNVSQRTKEVSPTKTYIPCVRWNTEMSRALTPLFLTQEVLQYRQYDTHTNPIIYEDNPLSWWKQHGHPFPTLSRFYLKALWDWYLSSNIFRQHALRLIREYELLASDLPLVSAPYPERVLIGIWSVSPLTVKVFKHCFKNTFHVEVLPMWKPPPVLVKFESDYPLEFSSTTASYFCLWLPNFTVTVLPAAFLPRCTYF